MQARRNDEWYRMVVLLYELSGCEMYVWEGACVHSFLLMEKQ